MSKVCLVTGGLGFIGQYVVRELLQRGETVRILDLAQPAQPIPGVDYIQGSITDSALVKDAMRGVDWVFHLAANAGLWSPQKQDFLTINQVGTRNVMLSAHLCGVQRVVHTSTESILKTDRKRETRNLQLRTVQNRTAQEGLAQNPQQQAVDGIIKEETLIDESVQLAFEDMVGAYCQGKYLAEQEAFTAAKRGLPVVIVNPTIPIGPGDRRLTPPSRMILGFLNGDYPAFLNSSLNMVDARDVAIGHILAAERGRVGERYLLGNANLQLKELLQILNRITGLPMPRRQVPYWLAYAVSVVQELMADYVTHKPPQAPLTGVRLAGSPMSFSSQKAHRELGFVGRPVELSLRQAVDWYRERGLLTR
ncbi:MAG: NAD-dependent epimerase/dehydratase family protein [Cyanobacteria bacterium J06623_5]